MMQPNHYPQPPVGYQAGPEQYQQSQGQTPWMGNPPMQSSQQYGHQQAYQQQQGPRRNQETSGGFCSSCMAVMCGMYVEYYHRMADGTC